MQRSTAIILISTTIICIAILYNNIYTIYIHVILPVDDSINEPHADENFLTHYLPPFNCNSHSSTLLPPGLSVCLCAITNRNAEIYLSVCAGVSWQVRCLSLLFSGSRFAKQTVKIARTCHVLVAARRRECS